MARVEQDKKNRKPVRARAKPNEIASAEPTTGLAPEGRRAAAVPVKVTDAQGAAVKGTTPDSAFSFEQSYNTESTDYFDPEVVAESGDDTSAGGAFAPNVGPDGDGVFPAIAPLDSEIVTGAEPRAVKFVRCAV